MPNVHPRVLEMALKLMPMGVEIQSAEAKSPEYAVFSVLMGDEVKQVSMPKVEVSEYLGGQQAEVMVNEGDTLEDVIAAVSAKYRLYLVAGLDYDTDQVPLRFGTSGVLNTGVLIRPDSVHVKGGFSIIVKDKAKFDRPKIAVCCALDEQKAQLALVSKVFPAYDVIVIGGGGLPKDFVQSLAAELIHVTIEHAPSVADMLEAEVVELIHDGISDIAVFRTAGERLWFVRYRLLSASDKEKAG